MLRRSSAYKQPAGGFQCSRTDMVPDCPRCALDIKVKGKVRSVVLLYRFAYQFGGSEGIRRASEPQTIYISTPRVPCIPPCFSFEPRRSRVGYAGASQLSSEMAFFCESFAYCGYFHRHFESRFEPSCHGLSQAEFSCFSAANLPLNPVRASAVPSYTAPAK